ncbi:MAG: DUF86 domain-containing protein [Nanoarchaeota archaeon]
MDKTLLQQKLELLADLLEKIKQILLEHDKNQKLQEFLLYAAEKKAEEIVELAVTINQEILGSKGKIALSYYETFSHLSRFSLFTEEELRQLASTAGFRNRLAHEYLEIDRHIALRTMKNMMPLYSLYLQRIKKFSSK